MKLWHGGDSEQEAFDTLKEKLLTAPVLAHPDFSQPFILETDAFNKGFGAVLLQEQEEVKRVIVYARRGLRAPEHNMENYSSMKLELLAMKRSITEKFRHYLIGNYLTVLTDNTPYVMSCYLQ